MQRSRAVAAEQLWLLSRRSSPICDRRTLEICHRIINSREPTKPMTPTAHCCCRSCSARCRLTDTLRRVDTSRHSVSQSADDVATRCSRFNKQLVAAASWLMSKSTVHQTNVPCRRLGAHLSMSRDRWRHTQTCANTAILINWSVSLSSQTSEPLESFAVDREKKDRRFAQQSQRAICFCLIIGHGHHSAREHHDIMTSVDSA